MNIRKQIKITAASLALLGSTMLTNTAMAQVTHAGDVEITGSACIGDQCTDGETFGNDEALRLKDNGIRLQFEDTSTSFGFPSNDWQILINDIDNGGGNYFAIEDSTTGRIPFKIEAGAGHNALFIRNNGNVGLGTSSPAVDLHIRTLNSPTLRLEQDGQGALGFASQTWDLAGNETNYYVRDVTNSFQLPFRIMAGAPSDALDIAASGNIGFGTQTPDDNLDIVGDAPAFRLTETGAGAGFPIRARLNNGSFRLSFVDGIATQFEMNTDADVTLKGQSPSLVLQEMDAGGVNEGDPMRLTIKNNTFRMSFVDGIATQFLMDTNGNVTLQGELTTSGPACAMGCDAVFGADYDLPSIEEHAKSMFANKHLPAIGATKPNAAINVSERMGTMLNELEKAHIYIAQMDAEHKAEMAEIKAQLALLMNK